MGNLKRRVERLAKLAGQLFPPSMPKAAMTDEELAEAIDRFLAGEPLKAAARSSGRPSWSRLGDSRVIEVSEQDLRDGIRRLLEPACEDEVSEGEETSAEDGFVESFEDWTTD